MDVREAEQFIQPIRDQFLLRYYRWALRESKKEFSQGFPLVRQIKGPSAIRFVHFADHLDGLEKERLSSALVKRFHERAVELTNEFSSPVEQSLLDQFLNRGNPDAPPEIDIGGFSHARFRARLLKKLVPVLGDPIETVRNGEISIHKTMIRCWTLSTWIDMGSGPRLRYSHAISAREPVHLQDNISILSWMGISSQTDWSYLKEGEMEQAGESLVQLCSQFLSAVPELLESLSHNLPEPEVRAWRELVTVTGHRTNGLTVVLLDSQEYRKSLRGKATWDIPTSIIPARLRSIGSHFAIVQDPTFNRESSDPLALSTIYRHLKVEPIGRH
jgi:hypothetical protein